MRKLLLILIASMTVSSQAASTDSIGDSGISKPASTYFISDSGICAGALTAKQYDVKTSLKYDTLSRDSIMDCTNVCKWQYRYTVDSTYAISYLTEYTAVEKVYFSFFDSLNRAFKFTMNVPQATVDSIWGDTVSLPGYNKVLYAKIDVPSVTTTTLSIGSYTLIGTLKQNPNVSFSATIIPWTSNCGCPQPCGCDDSVLPPQGKWHWLYTTSVMMSEHIGPYGYSDPSTAGHNYYYLFNKDSVYAFQDTVEQYADTIGNVNLCNKSFYAPQSFCSTDISAACATNATGCTYGYSFIGDKLLSLRYNVCGTECMWVTDYTVYLMANGTSVDPKYSPLPNVVGKFSVKQLSNRNVQVIVSLSKGSDVSLTLYSVSGKLVSNLFKQYQSAGKYSYILKMPVLQAGCYLLVLKKGTQVESARLNYVR